MDKTTYLAELTRELKGLAETDRENALAYYTEYLDDAASAGEEDPSSILGSPRTLAAQIKADIAMTSPALDIEPVSSSRLKPQEAPQEPDSAAAPAPGFVPPPPPPPPAPAYQPGYQPGYQPPQGNPQQPPAQAQPKQKSGIGVVWTVILAILAIPVGIPLAAVLFALIVSVLAVLFSLLVSLAAIVFSFGVGGLASFIAGFFLLFASFPVGLFYLGSGLFLMGLAICLGIAFWYLWRAAIRGVAKLFNSIRKRLTKKERGA